jgi:transcriptional regulator with XRE-family HTH domain
MSGTIGAAILAAPRLLPTAVTVAIDFGQAGSGWAGSVIFNVWLRRQLRERRMSQRQLAFLSGVDHSTISRLLRGDRTPNLATATKLARAVSNIDDVGDAMAYWETQSILTMFPMQRVEAALRGDEKLEDDDVRQLMMAYLRLRTKSRPSTGPSAHSPNDKAVTPGVHPPLEGAG